MRTYALAMTLILLVGCAADQATNKTGGTAGTSATGGSTNQSGNGGATNKGGDGGSTHSNGNADMAPSSPTGSTAQTAANHDGEPAMAASAEHANPKSPLDFTVTDIDGKSVDLSRYRGRVVLIVNTASLCGHTPQYTQLEALYEKYQPQGLSILAFPANDFRSQEPGTNAEIKEFCSTRYHVKFDLFGKVVVHGDGICPLYTYLTSTATDPQHGGDIKWNFTKFLVDRHGAIVDRFEPTVIPDDAAVVKAIEAALAEQVQ